MSSNYQFTNNAASTLASSILIGATSLTVAAGTGGLFPTLTGSNFFYCTLQNTAGTVIEIVKVTARSTDTFTIVRAQEGTSASAFALGDKVELRLTAGEINLLFSGATLGSGTDQVFHENDLVSFRTSPLSCTGMAFTCPIIAKHLRIKVHSLRTSAGKRSR